MLHQPLGGNRSLHGLAGLGGNPDSTIVAALPAFRPVSVVDVALRELIDREGLRPRVKVIVGGAPVTRKWAEEIGADGYGKDAMAAVTLAKGWVGAK